MSTDELPEHLKEHWPRIREQLLEGTYEPMAVRRREIPKSGGGVRQLGIPTVLDRFNHDGPTFGRCPMGRPAKRVGDRRLLRTIRRYLEAGVMAALRSLYAGLRLGINEEKSAVGWMGERQFLGHSFWVAAGQVVKRCVSKKALSKCKERIRQITSRSGGRSLEQVVEELRSYLLGWKQYFGLADTPGVFRRLDQWIHRRLRALQAKQWRRGTTAYRELVARGVAGQPAAQAARFIQNWWRISTHPALHQAMPGASFEELGLPRLAAE